MSSGPVSNEPYDNNNIFARILRGELPCQKIYEDDDTLVIMDIMPRGTGHCLVLPKQPARNILDCDDASLTAVAVTTGKIARAVKKAFAADGVTIQQFNEAAGGQEVFHLHVHVIARHDGIRLNPPGVMGKPEAIAENAEKIRAALARG
jgi:histidine triad (HIT) family protein